MPRHRLKPPLVEITTAPVLLVASGRIRAGSRSMLSATSRVFDLTRSSFWGAAVAGRLRKTDKGVKAWYRGHALGSLFGRIKFATCTSHCLSSIDGNDNGVLPADDSRR